MPGGGGEPPSVHVHHNIEAKQALQSLPATGGPQKRSFRTLLTWEPPLATVPRRHTTLHALAV